MKLIHTGDLHLDARLEAGLTPARARERRSELLKTFTRLAETAAGQNIPAVLIAGDLFDTERAGELTRRYVGDVIAAHPTVRFLCVPGNHDETVAPIFTGEAPENWHLFPRTGWDSVALDAHTVVSGSGDLATPGIFDRLPVPQSPDGEPVFHIVLLHGEISKVAREAADKIPLPLLKKRGVSYLALGHEHTVKIEPLERGVLYAYPGCPEGRGYDECGEKGYLLLDTNAPRDACVTFVPFAVRTLHHIDVPLDDCPSLHDMEARLASAIASLPERDMVKVTLTGALDPDLPCDTSHLSRLIADRFYGSRVEDKTTLRLRPEDYANDVSLKGEFIRTVLSSRLSREEQERVILYGLRALRGEEVDV